MSEMLRVIVPKTTDPITSLEEIPTKLKETVQYVKELSPVQASMETIENISLESLRVQNEQAAVKPTETEESDNNERRGLTEEEKAHYKEKLGCSDHLLDNATIDENGKIYINTINNNKEGQEGENGVKYVRKTIEINGIKMEGVFPEFESALDVQLPKDLLEASDAKQAEHANEELKNAIENDPELAEQFTPEQLEQIKNGETPDGYTWHHNESSGKMQLVKTADHQANRHTGGKAIWGGGKENR